MSDPEKKLDVEKTVELVRPPEVTLPSNGKRILIMSAVYLSLFLVTLDSNIIAAAIPKITGEFHSLEDIGWYGGAYLLTTCACQLFVGRVYKFYPAKKVFMASIIVFEIGSAVCGSAPNSIAFILGRAIAGSGSTGIFAGMIVMMVYTVPLRQRPIYQSVFGAVFALGSVLGPLLGGALTDKVTWRFCFYINLPIGAVAMAVIFFFVNLTNQKLQPKAPTWTGKLMQLDPISNSIFLPAMVCLLLALQWGGATYLWSSWRIIVLLVIAGVLIIVFVGLQIKRGDDATVPPRLVSMRNIAASIWFTFFNFAATQVLTYYLPIYQQAIMGVSALESGLRLLPLVLAYSFATIGTGFMVPKVGYLAPFFIVSSIVAPVGVYLISRFTPTTTAVGWIGFEVVAGIGLGIGAQQPMTVVATQLPLKDVSTGSAIMFFARFLGAALFLPVGQNIFLGRLLNTLTNLPHISASEITNTGATALRNLAQGPDLTTLLIDYNGALVHVFYMVVAMSGITIFGSVCIEWKNFYTAKQEAARLAKLAEQRKSQIESIITADNAPPDRRVVSLQAFSEHAYPPRTPSHGEISIMTKSSK